MSRKTLDQIRTEVALQAKNQIGEGAEGGDKIKNFPTMIQNHGVLASLAYSTEYSQNGNKYKNQAEFNMSKFLCNYLNKLSEYGYTVTENKNLEEPNDLINHLVNCSPEQFRRINAEIMAFLNYFRRFAS